MRLSIVIVNWKSVLYLRECLRSICANTRFTDYEIAVIDNASYDGAATLIPAEFPDAIFIQSAENLGFARANNRAVDRTSGQILLFLNPDTQVAPGALDTMLDHLQQEPDAAIAGPRLLNTDGSLQTSCVQAFPCITNQLLNSALLRRIFPNWKTWGMTALFSNSEQAVAVDAVSGACLMIRRDDFERVGRFTETYFMYSEDLDLNYKVAQLGRRIDYLPSAHVTHHGGCSSTQQGPHFASLRQKEAVLQFFQSTKSPAYCATFRLGIAVMAAIRIGIVVVLTRLWRGKSAKNWRQVLGKWVAIFHWATGWKSLPLPTASAVGPSRPPKEA
jgi:N-acetylglucosaminyl-diphospho-decaprenol L-rhamnosyltransferase